MDLPFNPDELELLSQHVDKLPPAERAEVQRMLAVMEERVKQEAARENFLEFMTAVEPTMLQGPQHRMVGKLFERIANGTLKRVIIAIAPRHSKSTMASYLLPAWFLGRFPQKKIIMASHTGDLAVDFGRKVRNLIDSEPYRGVFPDIKLAHDAKAAGRWNTNKGGEYFALGVGAAMAGRGADLLIIDDPVSEQEARSGNPAVYDSVYEWYQGGPRQRLQPGGAIVVLATRWDKRDLSGRLIDDMIKNPDGDQWEVVELPAILPSGKPLWPEFWPLEELLRTKASMDSRYWQAQYMQNPISEEGAIIKREWWKRWEKDEPPPCEYIIAALDAAAEAKTTADHSAIVIMGVFYHPNEQGEDIANLILLDCIRERLEFPELKDKAYEVWKEWTPDSFIVEKKSAGTQLYQEFRRAGIPVQEFTPTRATGDKTVRLNAVADIVRSGIVWAPQKRWADDLIDEVAGFPSYGSDDRVDCVSMILARFRNGGFIRLPKSDRDYDDDEDFTPPRRSYY